MSYQPPTDLAMTLNQGSLVTSFCFHPGFQTLLLVGTNTGDVMLWELGSKKKIFQKSFSIWDIGLRSIPLQTSLNEDFSSSINRVNWNYNGSLFGIAYSKNIVHVYSMYPDAVIRKYLEIEAHDGGVNDVDFSYCNKLPVIVTCGDDKLIKVWDVRTGDLRYQFEGHEAPVYCVCLHFEKNNLEQIISTATDGKIKEWLYESGVLRNTYDAPAGSTTRLVYTADGTRLFSCGTNENGESFIVEWDEIEGSVKRTYNGLVKGNVGDVMKFDITKNRFIVAGNDSMVKYWNMDDAEILFSNNAEGGLEAFPCIRLNRNGTLLAVSTKDNCVKVLSNLSGAKLLQQAASVAASVYAARISRVTAPSSRVTAPSSRVTAPSSGVSPSSSAAATGATGSTSGAPMTLMNTKLREYTRPLQCRSVRLDTTYPAMRRVTSLRYTNSGAEVFAVVKNKLWEWQNTSTVMTSAQLWQPTSGSLNPEEEEDSIVSIAPSKKGTYVMSAAASSGKLSLYNVMTYERIITIEPSPPPAAAAAAATIVALHPQDYNVIVIGMDDSSIHVYHIRKKEVITILKGGHDQKEITGLAFSNAHNVLVSSGADSQLCVWSTDSWEKQASRQLQISGDDIVAPPNGGNTFIEFHQDETHLLVTHETQVAIFKAPTLEFVTLVTPGPAGASITHSTYSCDCESVYILYKDGKIEIRIASSLHVGHCLIYPSAYYLPPLITKTRVYPVVVAAHPFKPNQFALGFSDGAVYKVEPLESEKEWGGSSPVLVEPSGAGPS